MNVSFTSADINFNVVSDVHGNVDKAANYVGQLENLKDDIFQRDERGKANVMCFVGDWFMAGSSVGYKTDPKKPFAFFQQKMFNKMKHEIDKIAHNIATVFVLGNHEFDGGDKLLAESLEDIDAEILSTNLILDKSPAFKNIIDDKKLVNTKIISVEDDKKEGVLHKVLLLGISPVNMCFYDRTSKDTTFIDNPKIAQKDVKPEHYEKTMQKCLEEIEKFKAENPNGAVVILSHSGVHFAQNLVERSKHIDFVFDGHEHKNTIELIGNTPVVSLAKDFQLFANSKFHFDDDGKFSIKDYRTYNIKDSSIDDNKEVEQYYKQLLAKDLEPEFQIKTTSKMQILSERNIRFANNQLANFITEKILHQIKKQDRTVQIFALNASAMRTSLSLTKPVSNIEIMNVLKGINDEDAEIVFNEVNGEELAQLVVNNILFNSINKERNPLVHYAGLTINKSVIQKSLEKGKPIADLMQYIYTDDGQALSKDKTYKIANVKKFFEKSSYPFEREMYKSSVHTDMNAKKLFLDYFYENKDNLHFNPTLRWV